MDFSLNSWGDIASFVAAVIFVAGILGWLVRKWVFDIIEQQVLPHLTNGEKSVAVYAHEARDAALDAKTAALDAKSAALSASASADKIALVVDKIDGRLKSLADSQGGKKE